MMINHIEDVVQSIFLKESLLQVLEEVYFACSVCLHAFFILVTHSFILQGMSAWTTCRNIQVI